LPQPWVHVPATVETLKEFANAFSVAMTWWLWVPRVVATLGFTFAQQFKL